MSSVARTLDGMLVAAFPFVVSEALLAEYRMVLLGPNLRKLHGLKVAEVVETGRPSIKVRVEVYAQRHPAQPIAVKVTEAVLTDVAINQQGEKRELPETH